MLNLELFRSLYGLCSADVTAGRAPNPVSHTDNQVVLSALYW